MFYSNLLDFNIPHIKSLCDKKIIQSVLSTSASHEYFIRQKALLIPEQKEMILISRYSNDGVLLYYVLESEQKIFTINTHEDFIDNEIIELFEQDYLTIAA